MPGTHRARRPGRRPWLVATAAAVAAVVAVAAVALLLRGGGGSGSSGSSAPRTSSPAAASSKPSSSSPPPAPTATLPAVAPAPPQRMQVGDVPGVGFGQSVPRAAATAAPDGGLFARLASRGLPGSPGRDTVVVLGGAGPQEPFGATSLRPGTAVVLETSRGRLTYRIDTVRGVDAQQWLSDSALQGRVPGRLVLVAVQRDARGTPTGRVQLGVAHLTGARTF